jgi:hypothetical protein
LNWTEFLAAKKRLCDEHDIDIEDFPLGCPSLFMRGVAGDNRTSCQDPGMIYKNDLSLFDGLANRTCDFVWTGRDVRVGTGVRQAVLTGRGHPALAGLNNVLCAGEIHERHFFFKSGHYHPKRENALFFITDFIQNSFKEDESWMRDLLVAKLCEIELGIFSSDTAYYNTTFERETRPRVAISVPKPSSSGRSPTSQPVVVTTLVSPPVVVTPSVSPPPMALVAGITAPGLNQLSNRRWVSDSERTNCALCKEPFTKVKRRHHCRQCGDIFCDNCSKNTKVVAHPVAGIPEKNRAKNEKVDKVRVCRTCFGLIQLT